MLLVTVGFYGNGMYCTIRRGVSFMVKRISAVILAALLLCVLAVPSFAAADDAVKITGEYTICVSEGCSAADSAAAGVLADYLEKIMDVRLKIASAQTVTGKKILVGEAAGQDFSSLADNSYKICERSGDVLISGSGKRGTVSAVYAFLVKFGGINAYTSALIEVPKSDCISVPKDTEITYSPFFEYAETDWLSPYDAEYSLFNGLTGGVYRKIDENMGGTVNYISGFCHTLTTEFCSSDTYFSSHPEYFALHSGERTAKQLCLTNEDVYNIVLSEVMQLLSEKWDPEADLQILSVTQNDNDSYCECDACKALDDANGSHQGTLLTFVNRIAKEVAAAGYDNVAIDTFAYVYTRRAPSQVVPDKNVIIRLCTIECCFSHTLDDSSCEYNTALMKDLRDWAAICDRLYIWDYTNNYAQTLGIYPDFGVIQRNLQIFAENGVKGVYEEGNYYMRVCDTEFGELRAYLLSKCLQDPYCDVPALTKAFLNAYYGAAADDIGAILDMYTENAASHHLFICLSMAETLTFSDEEIKSCDALWQSALSKTENTEQYANVERSLLSWRYWKGCCNKGEFSSVFSRISEKKQLKADLINAGVEIYGEGVPFEVSVFYLFRNPKNWIFKNTAAAEICEILGLLLSFAGYAMCMLAALVMLIKGLKHKKRFFIAPFAVYAVMLEFVMWHRRAFLGQRDVAGYALTFALLAMTFALMFIAYTYAGEKKTTAKRFVKSGITGGIVFALPFASLTYLLSDVIFKENGNTVAISVALAYAGVLAAVMSVLTLKRLISSTKKPRTTE